MSSLDRSAIERQCRALFWDIYLPRGLAEVRDGMLLRCNYPANWTLVILELKQGDPVFDLAFSALSISRVGRSNHDARLVKESNKLYGRALKALQRALGDETRMHTDEMLAACSVLGLYEVFEGGCDFNQSVGWISHAEGVAGLIKLRGPLRHRHRQAHHFFLGARLPIIYSAIVRRKRTFLADHDWHEVPFQEAIKGYQERFVDLFTRLPGVLEDFDDLRARVHASTAQARITRLLSDCRTYQAQLTKWDQGRKQQSLPVSTAHEKPTPDDEYPWSTEWKWENHIFLNASLTYWSAQLVIAVTISQIECLLASLGFATPDAYERIASEQRRARRFAVCIAQAIPYALMPSMGTLGINYITFPLCLAFKQFVEFNEGAVCTWLMKVCNEIRRQGVRMDSLQAAVPSRKHQDNSSWTEPVVESHTNVLFDKDVSIIKKEDSASDEESNWSLSPTSVADDETFVPMFIYENPAKYYLDLTLVAPT